MKAYVVVRIAPVAVLFALLLFGDVAPGWTIEARLLKETFGGASAMLPCPLGGNTNGTAASLR